jgi:hypothetical protein
MKDDMSSLYNYGHSTLSVESRAMARDKEATLAL